MQPADQDAILDQVIMPGWRALIIIQVSAAQVGDGSIIKHIQEILPKRFVPTPSSPLPSGSRRQNLTRRDARTLHG